MLHNDQVADYGHTCPSVSSRDESIEQDIDLTPGCYSCKKGKGFGIHVCPGCSFCTSANRDMNRFCFHDLPDCKHCKTPLTKPVWMNYFEEKKLQLATNMNSFDSIAWTGGEPMHPLVIKKILPIIEYFKTEYPNYHQWVHTSGAFANLGNMHNLRNAGISELRFNLADLDFSNEILDHMKKASRIFPYVVAEIPITRNTYSTLIPKMDRILETGVYQLSIPVSSHTPKHQYTTVVMDKASENNWPIVINDCSNKNNHPVLN